jgi:hypothetical protein
LRVLFEFFQRLEVGMMYETYPYRGQSSQVSRAISSAVASYGEFYVEKKKLA